jgi:hypothetical protein
LRISNAAGALLGCLAIGYLLLISFPQPLFAYSVAYDRYTVHSREPMTGIEHVIDAAEQRLKVSPIYNDSVRPSIYLTNGHRMYALLSHKAYKSFANSVPFIDNIFINKTDISADLVYIDRPLNDHRSLSGVIAHEVTHLLIRQRYGTVAASMMPVWKNEGYCEYIAGDSTIPLSEGIRLWRENPSDDSSYRYLKYHAMIKYLLEVEGMTVDEMFTRTLDEKEVAARTFNSLPRIELLDHK